MSDFFSRLHQAKNLRDVLNLISWRSLNRFVSAPLLLLMLAPLIFFIQITINDGWRFGMSVEQFISWAYTFGFLTMAVGFAKLLKDGFSVQSLIADRKPVFWFLMLTMPMGLSTCVNGFTHDAHWGSVYRGESLYDFMFYGLLLYGGTTMISSQKIKRILLDSYLIGSTVISVFALLDKYSIVPVWHFHMEQEKGTLAADFYQYNHFAYYLMLSVMLSLGLLFFEKKRILQILYFSSAVLHTMTLTVNKTRGCYLACIVAIIAAGIIIHLWDKPHRKHFWIGLAAFIIGTLSGALLMPENFKRYLYLFIDVQSIISQNESADAAETAAGAGTGRWGLWKLTIGYIMQKPLLGWGTEGISDMLYKDSNWLNSRPHCEYLQYAAFYGIPAMILYLVTMCSIYLHAFRQRKELQPVELISLFAAFTYLVSAAVGNTMYYTAPYLFILLGLGFRTTLKKQNQQA